jgi:hypothetical protein
MRGAEEFSAEPDVASAGTGPTGLPPEERNDIAEGNVWPEEEGELGPCPFGPPCTNAAHHELARIQAADRAAEERRRWRRESTRGMDLGLFC